MTPQPATPETALQVNATPGSALRNDAIAQSNKVLATGATAPGKRTGGRVVITMAEFSAYAVALYTQTELVAPDEVHLIATPEELRDRLAEYSAIAHVWILLHMMEDELLFSYKQLTLTQTQTVLDGSVPRIARWSFEGCSIGRGTGALYAFAAHFGIARMEAWTHYHHIEPWGKTTTGPASSTQIAAMHTEIDRAAKFLAKGSAGATYAASEIEATLQHGMPVALISEFFTFELEGTMVFADVLGDPRWFDAMTQQAVPAPWTTVRHPSEAWYPRSAFVSRVVSSPPEASAFEQYFDSNPVLYHVIVMPPVPTP